MDALPEPYASQLPPLLAAALAEDLPDVTSTAIFTADHHCRAALAAKAPGVVCGMPAFAAVFGFLDAAADVVVLRNDGAPVVAGDTIATVSASTRAVLSGERTALNFVMRLSGIATLARRFVVAVEGTRCAVLDTRKTTPGFRRLEKHAVRCGGATNHRLGLFDAAMIKDTHIAACGSITAAVARVRDRWGEAITLVVEAASLADVDEALACRVPHILLDNMDLATLRDAVERVAGRARLEASGGVSLDTVRAIAETGVDFVSVGAITHSAPALDVSLKVKP